MIDLLTIIARLQKEREEQRKEPVHIEFTRLMNEVSKEVRKELNRLYSDGEIKITNTLNEIGKKSPRSLASVDELPLIFLEFSFAVSKIIIIFVA